MVQSETIHYAEIYAEVTDFNCSVCTCYQTFTLNQNIVESYLGNTVTGDKI